MTISHPELVANLAKPGEAIISDLTPDTAHLLHMAIGISGEVAELLEAVSNADDENVVEECGDIEFYLQGMASKLGLELIRANTQESPFLRTAGASWLVLAAGEVLDNTKKVAIYADLTRVAALKTAVEAFARCMDDFYRTAGLGLDNVKKANIAKLSTRYSAGSYSNEAAKTRADKA